LDHGLSLVERVKQGERSAFAELIEQYQRPLFDLALRWTRSRADAEDIVQRAFMNAYEGIGSFRGQSSIKTWLFRIVLNLLKNESRYQKRRKAEEIDDTIPSHDRSPLDQSMLNEEVGAILKVVDRLKPKQKSTLLLRIFQELSFNEIAQAMKCSENTAKVNFHYAVKNLKQWLVKEGLSNEVPVR
jgi:RNA polymerase sigma-70 factor (ECF subfamily)